MQNIIKKKTALVTGGTSKLGQHLVRHLIVTHGYRVIFTVNCQIGVAENLVAELSSENASFIRCDLTIQSEIDLLARTMMNQPCWDLLINNASCFELGHLLTTTRQDLERDLSFGLFAPLALSQALAQNSNGHVINMLDINIARKKTKYFPYLLSKKILAELTEMLEAELAPQIRASSIFISSIDSEIKLLSLTNGVDILMQNKNQKTITI